MKVGTVDAPVFPIAIAATSTSPLAQVGCPTVTLVAAVADGMFCVVVAFHVMKRGMASLVASLVASFIASGASTLASPGASGVSAGASSTCVPSSTQRPAVQVCPVGQEPSGLHGTSASVCGR